MIGRVRAATIPEGGFVTVPRHVYAFQYRGIRNRLQSVMLFTGLVLLCSALGWLLWGVPGLVWLGILAVLVMLIGPRVSPHLVLRMYHARRLTDWEAPDLITMARQLARRADLAFVPALYYVPSRVANAFTVGTRDDAAIAVTDGLLRNFTVRELQGVLAHEIGHVRRNDGLVMAMADIASQMVNIMSWIGIFLLLINLPLLLMGILRIPWLAILLLVFAPTLSSLLQLALSRTREFEADLEAVRLTGDPRGLASGLSKIEQLSRSWFERIFLPGRRVPEPSMLRTHPATEQRIKRLLEMEADLGRPEHRNADRTLPAFDHPPARFVAHPRWHFTRFWF